MLRVAVSSLENAIVIDMEPTMSMQKRVLYTPSRHPSQLERIATFKNRLHPHGAGCFSHSGIAHDRQ